MIGRLLLITGIILLVWMGYRFLKKTRDERFRDIESEAEEDKVQNIQHIKACAYCKTHIPEEEGINKDGEFFCSYEHLDNYLKQQSE